MLNYCQCNIPLLLLLLHRRDTGCFIVEKSHRKERKTCFQFCPVAKNPPVPPKKNNFLHIESKTVKLLTGHVELEQMWLDWTGAVFGCSIQITVHQGFASKSLLFWSKGTRSNSHISVDLLPPPWKFSPVSVCLLVGWLFCEHDNTRLGWRMCLGHE